MKKYFFFDIDNTLTDYTTKQIPNSTRETIQRLQENGHFVAIATGRSFYSAYPVLKDANIQNCVCSGGKGLYIDGKLVKDDPLDLQSCLNLIEECQTKDIPIGILPKDEDTIYCFDDRFQKANVRRFSKWIIDDQLNIYSWPSIHKMYILTTKEDEKQLSSLNHISHFRYHPRFLSIQADEKYTGILEMMKSISGDISQIVVFGDELNDLDMFLKAPFSIAMGNGIDELKKIASYITDTSKDDGIYKACRYFGWI